MVVIGQAVKNLSSLDVHDNIFLVSDGDEAAKVCSRVKIHALLTDIKMPNKTGDELINDLRHKEGKDFPIFVMTSFSTEKLVEDLEKINAVKVYKKPIDIETLLKELSDYLDKMYS